MFNAIAGKYDFLNHFLSLGIDRIWRRKLVDGMADWLEGYENRTNLSILDIASGTGDQALEAIRLKPEKITGVDISEHMLAIARRKAQKKKADDRLVFQPEDAENLSFSDDSFDLATISFGIRNFENLDAALQEIQRVLKPGGGLFILEFSKPQYFPVKQIYTFYLNQLVPKWGKWIAKDKRAYRYLSDSIGDFIYGNQMTDLLRRNGFINTGFRPVTAGIVTIYRGVNPA